MRTYSITQDLNGGNNLTSSPIFKQYDEGQTMNITITYNGSVVDLSKYSVIGFFKLPNKSVEQVSPKISGNTLNFTLGGDLLLYPGYGQLEVRLYKDNTITTTFSISYGVESSINTSAGGSGSGDSGTVPGTISENKKYAILAFSGQSNSVGYDESPVDPIFTGQEYPRINQLGLYEYDNLNIIPLGHCAQNFQDMRTINGTAVSNPLSTTFKGTKGLHLPLSKLIINKIPEDYEILVIPAAYGGTGFTTGRGNGSYDSATKTPANGIYSWGTNSAYYLALKDRIKYALDLNPLNYFIGLVWCQGEADNAKPAEHYTAFQAMTNDFFSFFNNGYKDRVKSGTWGKEQWFIHDTVPYWKTAYPNTATIWNNYKTWSGNTFVTLDFGQTPEIYTNATNGTGQTTQTKPSHFGNNAFRDLVAPAVFAKMKENKVF